MTSSSWRCTWLRTSGQLGLSQQVRRGAYATPVAWRDWQQQIGAEEGPITEECKNFKVRENRQAEISSFHAAMPLVSFWKILSASNLGHSRYDLACRLPFMEAVAAGP